MTITHPSVAIGVPSTHVAQLLSRLSKRRTQADLASGQRDALALLRPADCGLQVRRRSRVPLLGWRRHPMPAESVRQPANSPTDPNSCGAEEALILVPAWYGRNLEPA